MKTLLATFFPNTLSEITLTKLNFIWTITRKIVSVQIENVGNKDTGPLVVEFDIEGENRFEFLVPHITRNLTNLERGCSSDLTADFLPFAQPDNNFLADANKIIIHVEGKAQEYLRGVYGAEKTGNII